MMSSLPLAVPPLSASTLTVEQLRHNRSLIGTTTEIAFL